MRKISASSTRSMRVVLLCPEAGGGHSQTMAVDAYSGIGEDTGPAHLDDLLAVGVDVADQSLLHGHAHVPVLDDVGASVSGSLSPDTEHAAFLRDVTEGLTEEIGGDVQQQDVVKGQTAALGDALELLVHLRPLLLEETEVLVHKGLIGLEVHLLLLQLPVDGSQVAADGIRELLPLLDALLEGRAAHLAIGVLILGIHTEIPP